MPSLGEERGPSVCSCNFELPHKKKRALSSKILNTEKFLHPLINVFEPHPHFFAIKLCITDKGLKANAFD